jgi:hypothetical protein
MAHNVRARKSSGVARLDDDLTSLTIQEQRFCITDKLLPNSTPLANQFPQDDGPLQLAMRKSTFWAVGKTLRVRLLTGASEKVEEKVKKYAKEWTKVANINLEFGNSSNAEIRVAFDKGGSWSFVGTEGMGVDRSKPTMNFGWLDDNTAEEEFARVILHEFGHALGCIHEHQSAFSTSRLKWDTKNVQKIYDYFKNTSNWDRVMVDHNVLNLEPAQSMEGTLFDDDSIMLYPYPGYLFVDGKGTSHNCKLSKRDKELINRIYPFRTRSDGRHCFDPAHEYYNAQIMKFDPPYKSPPAIALGLSQAHLEHGKRRTVGLSSTDISEDSFRVQVFSWKNTKLLSGTATWLEHDPTDYDVQCK